MKVRATATAMGAALLCGFAAPVDHSFDVWGTGGDSLAFNRMTGNCEGVTHAFGRNAAWGLWKIPLEGVSLEVVPAERGTDLRFRCDEGAACIRAGALDDTPERISSHAVRYDRADDARIMLGQIEALRTACNGG